MNEQLARWLHLRERADFAARSEALTGAIADALPGEGPVRAVDLATGTGSNIRYLAERLGPRPQRWLAVDRRVALLSALRDRMRAWGADRGYDVQHAGDECIIRGPGVDCRIETRQIDLGTLPPGIFVDRQLVTASAVLDLVSRDWLRALAEHCRGARACALFAITYNGHSSCAPEEPEDGWVRELMNRHQTGDKGLGGPAAGPGAAAAAERAFADAGYVVRRDASDWTLEPVERELQRDLIDGWAQAALEVEPEAAARIASWRERRHAHVEAGRSRVVVHHDDLAAWLPRP